MTSTRRCRSSRLERHRRTTILVSALIALLAVLVTGCADKSAQNGDREPENNSAKPGPDADVTALSAQQWRKMKAAGMLRPECPITRRSQLRSVAINHYTFKGEVRRGLVVVNKDVTRSVVRILTKMYEAKFPIRRMSPVENYGGDTNKSLRADNTSAYNCRRPDQINAPFTESPHANGRAIDINPRENPWKDLRCRCWYPSAKEHLRNDEPGKINKGGKVWQVFRAEGWIWQDIDVADYMHFDTGYPSKPFRNPSSS